MAVSYERFAPIDQPGQRAFLSFTISPKFIRKQKKLAIIFAIMAVLGWSMSSNLYKAAIKEDGYDDPELIARDALENLIKDSQKAVPKTFFVDKGPANFPFSRLGFTLKDGTRIAYYENDGSLYCERDGEAQKILDGLVSAFFRLPFRSNRLLLAELQVWKSNDCTDCSPSTIQRFIDVEPALTAEEIAKSGKKSRLRRV